eukprot:jgi/Psemu1/36016/gm1.36016_g
MEEHNTINQSNKAALSITNKTTTTVMNQQKEGTKTNVVEKTSNGECFDTEDVVNRVMKKITDIVEQEVAKHLRQIEREPYIGVGKVVMVHKQTEATMQGEGNEYGHMTDNDMLKTLSNMTETLDKQLRDYIKKHWYHNMKFPMDDKVTAHVIQKAALRDDFLVAQCLAKPYVILSKKMQIRASSINDDTKAHIIYNSFTTLTNNTSRLKRFQTARFQVFKLWLDLKAQKDLKLKVDKLSTSIFSSRTSIPLPRDTTDTATTMQPLVPLPDIHHEESSISNLPPNVPPLAIEQASPDVIVSSPAVISSSLPDLSFHQLTTASNLQHWDSLKLAPLHYLQDQWVQLCLYICAREHIHEMAFSNPDFYSASGLVNHEHWRSISCEGADVRDELSGSNLIRIPSTVLQRLDPLNILDVIRPGSPVYRRCQVHYKGDLLKLFHFVVFHGKSPTGTDLRHIKDNRSVEIGTHFETGIIQNTDKFDALREDSAVVKATVAQLMNFLWYVAKDVQITAKRCPLAGHVCGDNRFGIPFQNAMGAKSSLFHCVTLVVSQVYPYPCQGKRHRDTLNDSIYAYSQTVVGNWYFQDGEGRIYLLQMLCNFRGSASSLFPHKVLYIGYDLICWINALKQIGVATAEDLPVDVIDAKMDSVVNRIQSPSGINGLDFGRFYLSQWLNIPSKGTASFDHFLNPTKKDVGNGGVQPVPVEDLDTMMKFTSQALHHPQYLRTCMKTLGCESVGHRDLNIKDVFIKDGLLFEIDQHNGIPVQKMPE